MSKALKLQGNKRALAPLLALIALFLISSCAKDEEALCDSLDNCQTQGEVTSKPRASIELEPTKNFDVVTGIFREYIPNQNGDIQMNSLRMITDDLLMSYEDAIDSITASLNEDKETSIPHIIVKMSENQIVKLRYTKRNANQEIVEQRDNFDSKRLVPNDSKLIIPIINEFFYGALVDSSAGSGNVNSFSHEIELFTLADGFEPSLRKRVYFKIEPTRKPASADIVIHDDTLNFRIEDRWQKYFKEIDYVANEEFNFFKLVDNKETPDLFSYDIKFIFKSEPTLKLRQKVFFEETFDALLYATSGIRFYRRGEKFYVNEQTFDSTRDFNKKFKINDQVVLSSSVENSSNSREIELRDIEGGTRWELSFLYDFTKNENFNVGAELLSPLRPECNNITNQAFSPLQEEVLRSQIESEGGVLLTCHPDTDKREIIEANELDNPPISVSDLWYDSFFYRPSATLANDSNKLIVDAGSFYGVKEVEFSIQGCVKILVREASSLEVNPNIYEEKQLNSPECASEDEESGWMYFDISVTEDLYQRRFEKDYSGNSSIIGLIEKLFTLPENTYPNYYFNGSFDVHKIY